jgi:hypothetical protein
MDINRAQFARDVSGNIQDLNTGLVWRLGPDRNSDGNSARQFLDQLGPGWRLPTTDELRDLHDAGLRWPSSMGPFDFLGFFGNGLWFRSSETQTSFQYLNYLFGFTVFGSERRENNISEDYSYIRTIAVFDSTAEIHQVLRPDTIDHSDRFHIMPDGVIVDQETNLRWLVGPDIDTSFEEGRDWMIDQNAIWRFPTPFELEELYEAGVTTASWGPFKNTGLFVWCTESSTGYCYPAYGTNSWRFTYFDGGRDQNNIGSRDAFRVFAVHN